MFEYFEGGSGWGWVVNERKCRVCDVNDYGWVDDDCLRIEDGWGLMVVGYSFFFVVVFNDDIF